MKYLLILSVLALAGCGASKVEKLDLCTKGALIAVNAMRDAGATLPGDIDRSLITGRIVYECTNISESK